MIRLNENYSSIDQTQQTYKQSIGMSQSELKAKACIRRQARENSAKFDKIVQLAPSAGNTPTHNYCF